MTYTAPVRDICFTLEDVVAIDGLKSTGAFDDLSSDLTRAMLEEAGKLASAVLAPLNASGDQEGARLENGVVYTASGFKEAYARYVEGGWQGVCFPADHGGMGLPRALALAVSEMVQASNMAFGLGPMLTLGAIEALLAHGAPELQETYLPKLVTGEWTGAMNLTEPQSGSDLSGLRTKATPQGDGSYRIEGQKIYITWGDHDAAPNVIHLVLARLPDAPEGTRGVSLFLVPKVLVNDDGSLGARNEVSCIGLEHKLGIHASPTCTMQFGGTDGAIGWLIGAENNGLAHMFTMMNSARVNVGMQGVAIAERAYQQALAYAQDRRQGRGLNGDNPAAIIGHPDVRRSLLTMKSKIMAGRAMCLATAVAADLAEHAEEEEDRAFAKRREDLLTPIAKAWCTDVGVEATSTNIQIHGGMGFVEETGAAQHYRDARIAPIYEGTNGIQAIDLVGRKLKLNAGASMREMLEDIGETAEDMALSSNTELNELARPLGEAAEGLRRATEWLTGEDRNPASKLSNATAYLTLAGDVIGGYFLCVGAVSGARALKNGEGDQDYAQSRLDLARYYARTVLSTAAGRLDAVTAEAEVLFDIPEAMLGA